MHLALRKGPLFLQKTPPIIHFYKKHPLFHFFFTKTPPGFVDDVMFPIIGIDDAGRASNTT